MNFAEGAVAVKPSGSSDRYDTVNIIKDSLLGNFVPSTDEFGWYHDALSSRDEGAFYFVQGVSQNPGVQRPEA